MKASLKIELIGDIYRQQMRLHSAILDEMLGSGVGGAVIGGTPATTWVAEITGFDYKYKYKRTFVPFKKDYTEANGAFSRGVFACYILESGKIYEVKRKVSWRSEERYFCKVTEEGDIQRIGREEVTQWLKKI